MGESELEDNNENSIIKTHKEIQELIEEIKELEREYNFTDIEPEFIEIPEEPVEFIDVESDEIEELQSISKRRFKIKYRTREEVRKLIEEKKKYNPATFRIRFDDQGDLVNIDIKKNIPKRKHKKIKIDESEELVSEEHEEVEEREPKLSRFGKVLSVLRRSIPKKEELPEEEEEEEY